MDNDVSLRPIQEADLEALCRFATDQEAGGEFEWIGFKDPKALRRRWEEDGWIGALDARLAVVRSDGNFAGDVSWKDRSLGSTKGVCLEIGIALLPEHRGQGVGTHAQRLLVRYLFDTTPVHRLEAYTEVDNMAEQRALEKSGFEREGVLRELFFRGGVAKQCAVRAIAHDLSCLDNHSMRRPLIARAITKRWISEVPSKIV